MAFNAAPVETTGATYAEPAVWGGWGGQPSFVGAAPATSFAGDGYVSGVYGGEVGPAFGGVQTIGTGSVRVAGAAVTGVQNLRVRVPTKNVIRNIYRPGPVINRTVQGPGREVVRRVRVQGPTQIQKVQVTGPPRTVVRRVPVQGPPREVVRRVQVQGPPQIRVRKETVQGPPREIIKKVEVQGPPREVLRRVEVPGPPQERVVKVQVPVVGPGREIVRHVPVPRDVVRQVVKHVDVDQWVNQPVPVPVNRVRYVHVVRRPIVRVRPVVRNQVRLVPRTVMVPEARPFVTGVPEVTQGPTQVYPGQVVRDPTPAGYGGMDGYATIGAPGFGGYSTGYAAPAAGVYGGYPAADAGAFTTVDGGFNNAAGFTTF